MTLESTRWRNAQCQALLVPIEVEEIAAEPREEKLTLSGDVLFDFDSDQLSLEGRRVLDRVSDRVLDAYSSPSVLVVGYTDRFGKEQYNLNLSQARAEAVGNYLVSQGIERRNLTLLGRGEADPIVDCPGQMATPGVKACLRPNRRVEITLQ